MKSAVPLLSDALLQASVGDHGDQSDSSIHFAEIQHHMSQRSITLQMSSSAGRALDTFYAPSVG